MDSFKKFLIVLDVVLWLFAGFLLVVTVFPGLRESIRENSFLHIVVGSIAFFILFVCGTLYASSAVKGIMTFSFTERPRLRIVLCAAYLVACVFCFYGCVQVGLGKI